MARTFKGGIFPGENKLTKDRPIIKMPAPGTVVIPLTPFAGENSVPSVAEGDFVKKGQKIGGSEKKPVFSGISGRVAKTETVVYNGEEISAVKIENDFTDTVFEDLKPFDEPVSKADPEKIISFIREAGITDSDGVPVSEKAAYARGKVKTVVINCIESEPYLTGVRRMLIETPEKVTGGARILLFAVRASMIIFAVGKNDKDAADAASKHISKYRYISVKFFRQKYPQSNEKILFRSLFRREIPRGKTASDKGSVIFGAEAAKAVFDAFVTGMPRTEKTLTVSGDCVSSPENITAPIGTLFADAVSFCGGLKKKPDHIISGGPLSGCAQSLLAPAVITENCGGILALSKKEDTGGEPVCIRCGTCVSVCPMHLMPLYLARFGAAGKAEKAARFGIESCIECGACTYICPGNMPLMRDIRLGKAMLNDTEGGH